METFFALSFVEVPGPLLFEFDCDVVGDPDVFPSLSSPPVVMLGSAGVVWYGAMQCSWVFKTCLESTRSCGSAQYIRR